MLPYHDASSSSHQRSRLRSCFMLTNGNQLIMHFMTFWVGFHQASLFLRVHQYLLFPGSTTVDVSVTLLGTCAMTTAQLGLKHSRKQKLALALLCSFIETNHCRQVDADVLCARTDNSPLSKEN